MLSVRILFASLYLIPKYVNVVSREEKGKRITMFFDMGNAGLSNVDIPFISYLINLFKIYYPDLLNAIIVFELPFIMNGKNLRLPLVDN